jgi:L-alanine-DL-glutamate epimerase-like enolase superfamily enzyme
MVRAVRNIGRGGVASMAIAAVDTALWDFKARLLGMPLARLLGACRDAIAVYGSGGFTSYLRERLAEQLGGWAADGMRYVKMKVGRNPPDDPARVRAARRGEGETFGGVDYYGSTKDELYRQAKKLHIRGRSHMDKKELARAISHKR